MGRMERIVVRGGGPLEGRVAISGAKNSVLKLMAATVLAEGRFTIRNVPDITDVRLMSDLLRAMGLEVAQEGDVLTIDRPAEIVPEAPYELVEAMRASIVVLGPLVARVGRARVSMPGGDDFGQRPIDMHLDGLRRLGAEMTFEHGYIEGTADRLAVAGGELVLEQARPEHMDMLMQKLGDMGMRISSHPDGVWAMVPDRMRAVDINSLPYPGIATDYLPLLVAALSVADGPSIATENIFGGRFRYVDEVVRLGAHIRVERRYALIRGVERLSGAPVKAHEIRAGAAIAMAALGADGETVISDAGHVGRGYDRFAEKLRSIGADVDAD